MFEESMIESQIAHASATKQWTMAGSIAFQTVLATALITLPLIHPEGLIFHKDTPLVFTPPLPSHPVIPVVRSQPSSRQMSTTFSPVTAVPPLIATLIPTPEHDNMRPAMSGPSSSLFGMGETLSSALRNLNTHGTTVTVAPPPARTKPLRISGGISSGMLVTPIHPVYPPIARAAGVSGTVVVEAIISKAGTIESLRVISGPEMLRASAMNAIRNARYQPFRLNGEPTEAQTTITVNFTLGS
jgi:protein TonB